MANDGVCPTCQEANQYHPFPVGYVVFGFLMIVFLFLFLYAQYVHARKETSVCMRKLQSASGF